MGSVLTSASEACVACGSNFKPLARQVAEISVERSFPILTVCWGPTIGFRSEPAVYSKPSYFNIAGGLKFFGFELGHTKDYGPNSKKWPKYVGKLKSAPKYKV